MSETNNTEEKQPFLKILIEKTLFGSKWILIPIYFGLMITLGIYTYIDLREVTHLVVHFTSLEEQEIMILILRLVDMAMIANLVKMVITGSYNSFVSKTHEEETEKISSGLLKVKMATSLIGVSSIHMLQAFIKAPTVDFNTVWKLLVIHGGFIIGALALAWVDYLHNKSENH